jgi:hypothetical protein
VDTRLSASSSGGLAPRARSSSERSLARISAAVDSSPPRGGSSGAPTSVSASGLIDAIGAKAERELGEGRAVVWRAETVRDLDKCWEMDDEWLNTLDKNCNRT